MRRGLAMLAVCCVVALATASCKCTSHEVHLLGTPAAAPQDQARVPVNVLVVDDAERDKLEAHLKSKDGILTWFNPRIDTASVSEWKERIAKDGRMKEITFDTRKDDDVHFLPMRGKKGLSVFVIANPPMPNVTDGTRFYNSSPPDAKSCKTYFGVKRESLEWLGTKALRKAWQETHSRKTN